MPQIAYICTTTQPDDSQLSYDDLAYNKTAREALILQCVPAVERQAWRYQDRLRHSDIADLVQEAMAVITERVGEALGKPNPVRWLISIGKYAMIEYMLTQDTLIPHHHGVSHLNVESLNAPCQRSRVKDSDDSDETTFMEIVAPRLSPCVCNEQIIHRLYQALEKLSPTRQQLVAKRFGLLGYPETPLQEMAPTRRDQQKISKALAGAKKALASYLQPKQRKAAVA